MIDRKTKADIDSILYTHSLLEAIEKYLDEKYPETASDKGCRLIEMKDFESGGWWEQHENRNKDRRDILSYLFGV